MSTANAVATVENKPQKRESRNFDPRPLRLSYRRLDNEHWECRVERQQPFAGTHSWARTKGMARELLHQALRRFGENEG